MFQNFFQPLIAVRRLVGIRSLQDFQLILGQDIITHKIWIFQKPLNQIDCNWKVLTNHSQPARLSAQTLSEEKEQEREDEKKGEERDERTSSTPTRCARVGDLTHSWHLPSSKVSLLDGLKVDHREKCEEGSNTEDDRHVCLSEASLEDQVSKHAIRDIRIKSWPSEGAVVWRWTRHRRRSQVPQQRRWSPIVVERWGLAKVAFSYFFPCH